MNDEQVGLVLMGAWVYLYFFRVGDCLWVLIVIPFSLFKYESLGDNYSFPDHLLFIGLFLQLLFPEFLVFFFTLLHNPFLDEHLVALLWDVVLIKFDHLVSPFAAYEPTEFTAATLLPLFLLPLLVPQHISEVIAKSEFPFGVGLVEILEKSLLTPAEVDPPFPLEVENTVELEVVDSSVKEMVASPAHPVPATHLLPLLKFGVKFLVLPLVLLFVDGLDLSDLGNYFLFWHYLLSINFYIHPIHTWTIPSEK